MGQTPTVSHDDVESLRNKVCFYLKAYKGNEDNVVIAQQVFFWKGQQPFK